MKVSGIHAIVAGGGSGLGAATAELLAAHGAKVSILDISDENARRVAAPIDGFAVRCDVTSEASALEAIEAAVSAFGDPRLLVNCAGIGPSNRVVSRNGPYPLDLFARVIGVNLIGTFNMLRLVAARMSGLVPVGEERGVIVNTASVAAFDGQIGQAAYAASKAGVAGMTLPIARDLAQHAIRVNTIAPGLFLTPLLMEVSEEVRESLAAQVPFPSRLGRPSEYAELVLHIVSNTMLNAETIRLDGAIRMAPR
ncbi:3-hydroxyacyl-CoA dehydrogenase [Methylobacterium fujisawaense]|uniref:SDR family NAD(P)-dependent oxidoreductase n=1 Tax=Methylobacterium fujisawaense TaxID=107400 RepID=UPI002F322187